MTDLNTMTKAAINALLVTPLNASQLKKTSHADLVAMFDAMPAGDALDADLRDARADDTPPEPSTDQKVLASVLDDLTGMQKCVLVAHLDALTACNGATTLDAMREDNMSWLDAADCAKATGLTKNQLKGVYASLSSKGLLSCDNEKPNGAKGVDQVLTDFGIIAAFELSQSGVAAQFVMPADASLIQAVKDHAKANYEKGWDVVVETMEDADVARVIEGAKTAAAAVKLMKAHIAPHNEQRREHQREADAGNPKPVAPKKARVLEDRVIVAAATDLKMVRPTADGSKRHLLAQALQRGATIEHLMEVTGWNKTTATSALRWDIPQLGLGVERKGDKYFLILPAGVKSIPVKAKDMTRADALVAACK